MQMSREYQIEDATRMNKVFCGGKTGANEKGTLTERWVTQIAKSMGPTWGPPGSCRPQMGSMLDPETLL